MLCLPSVLHHLDSLLSVGTVLRYRSPDDLKAVRKNTDMIPQISEDIKTVRKTTDATLYEIKGISEAKAAFFERR